jgi:hypothetical protein
MQQLIVLAATGKRLNRKGAKYPLRTQSKKKCFATFAILSLRSLRLKHTHTQILKTHKSGICYPASLHTPL